MHKITQSSTTKKLTKFKKSKRTEHSKSRDNLAVFEFMKTRKEEKMDSLFRKSRISKYMQEQMNERHKNSKHFIKFLESHISGALLNKVACCRLATLRILN